MDTEAFWWRRFLRGTGLTLSNQYGIRIDRACRRCLLQGVDAPNHRDDMIVLRIVLVWGKREKMLWRLQTIRVPADDYPIIADMDD